MIVLMGYIHLKSSDVAEFLADLQTIALSRLVQTFGERLSTLQRHGSPSKRRVIRRPSRLHGSSAFRCLPQTA